jgi:hypothetical protein
MDIETLIWRAGTNRGVSIGVTAFSGPNTFTTYNNSTYTVPLIGETFYNITPSTDDYTTFLNGDYSVLIIGELTKAHVDAAGVSLGHTVTGINIGTSVTSIGNIGDTSGTAPFYNSGLTTVTFKDSDNSGCSIIGGNAFFGCSLITEILFPPLTITIGDNAFQNCNKLTGVSFPSSAPVVQSSYRYFKWLITDIKDYAGSNSVQVAEFIFATSDTDDSMTGVTGTNPGGNNPGSEGVTKLIDGSLSTKWLDFNMKSTHDSEYIFDFGSGETRSFTRYKIGTANDSTGRDPKTWTISGSNDNIDYTLLDTVTDGALSNTRQVYTSYYDMDNVDTAEIFTFGTSVFHSSGLSSIVLPGSLEYLPVNTFNSCSGLSIITFGDGVSIIGDSSFEGCTNLTGIFIPENILTIGISSFKNSTGLLTVDIGTSVTSVGLDAFLNAESINTLTWLPGYARGVTIGVSAFVTPVSFSEHVNTTYNVPAEGEIFTDVEPNTMTTFLGSDYSIFIDGELTNAHVYTAETAIGHSINGVNIGTSVTSIGNVGDTTNAPFYNSGVSIVVFKDITNSQCNLIGDNAFYGCSLILDLTLPNSLTIIEDNSFNSCSGLSFLVIPEGVTSIGNNSFEDCDNLFGISLPSSLITLGTNVFKSSGLSSIVLPDLLETVPSGAFNSCNGLSIIDLGNGVTSLGINSFINCNLTSLTIPENVLTIGASSFKNVIGLTTVNIGTSVTSVGADAFSGALSIETLNWDSGNNRNVTIGETAFSSPNTFTQYNNTIYNAPAIGEVFTPNITYTTATGSGGTSNFYINGTFTSGDVTTIESYLTTITDITFGSSINDIDSSAFLNNTDLVTISFINGCSIIGNNAFEKCSSVTSINFINSIIIIGNNSFQDCDNLLDISLPATLTTLGTNSFKSSGLTSIALPDSLDIVPSGSFNGCLDLSSIDFGNGVSSIGIDAFISCNLTSLTIPENVLTIGASSFKGVTGLTTVTIGTSVTSVGLDAFLNAESINTLTWLAGNAREVTIGISAFVTPVSFSEHVNTTYNVPAEGEIFINSIPDSQTTFLGSNYSIFIDGELTNAHVYTAETAIGHSINGVNIGTSVTSIGNVAFYNSGVSIVTFKDINSSGCSLIGDNAFYGCSLIIDLIFPESLINIKDNSFEGCSNLIGVSFPSSLISLGVNAFKSSGLSSIVLTNSLDIVPSGAFNLCGGLSVFDLGTGVSSIGIESFGGCSFSGISIPNNIFTIGISAFKDCIDLVTVDIGVSVTSIGADAFLNDVNIETLTWNAGIARGVTIGVNTFDAPNTFTEYNNTTYNVPVGGVSFVNIDTKNTFFIGATNTYEVFINGDLTGAIRNTAIADIGEQLVTLKIGTSCTQMTASFNNEIGIYPDFVNLSFLDIENSLFTSFNYSKGMRSSNVTALIMPPLLTSIGNEYFRSSGLTGTITFPSPLTTINRYSFSGCTGITSFIWEGAGPATIQNNTFNGCTGVTTFNIPTAVNTFEINACKMSNLTTLNFDAGNARTITIGTGAFNAPASFSAYFSNTTYDVPLGGSSFGSGAPP